MLNLGSLEFTLGINTRGLDEAYNRVRKFANTVGQLQGRANKGADTQISSYRRIENAIAAADRRFTAFLNKANNSKITPEVRDDLIKRASAAYDDFTKKVTSFKKVGDLTNLDRSMNDFNANLTSASNKLTNVARGEREVATAAKNATAQQERFAQAVERASIAQQRALASGMEKGFNLGQRIDLSGLDTSKITSLSDRLQAEMNKMRTALSGPTPLNPREFSAAVATYQRGLGAINRDLRQMRSDAVAPAIENFHKLRAALQDGGSAMLLVNGHLGGMSTRLIALSTIVGHHGIAWGVLAGAVTAAGVTMTALVRGALTAGMAVERVTVALGAVLGSTAAANTQLEYLVETADLSGQVFTNLAGSYTRFLAASTSAGQSIGTTQQQFRDISLAAGTLSLTVQDTEGVFRAFEQMLSKGTVQAEELRGQLGDRLPGAFAIAAQAMGVTQTKLNAMMKSGDVLAKDLLPKFIETMKVMYNIDGTPIDTLQAALNRASNSATLFFAAFANNTKIMAAAKTIVNGVANAVEFLTKNMDEIIDVTLKVSAAFAGAAAAWSLFALHAVASGTITILIGGLTKAVAVIRAATAGTIAWAAAIKTLDLVWMTSGIGRVVTWVLKLITVLAGAAAGYYYMNKALASLDGGLEAGSAQVAEYVAQQKRMGIQIKATTEELMRQQNVLLATETAKLRTETSELRRRKATPNRSFLGGLFVVKADVEGQRQKVLDQMRLVDQLRRDMIGLQEVARLPELNAAGPSLEAFGDTDKTKKEAENRIEAVLDFVLAYQKLQDQLDVMDQGPKAFEQLEAIYKARDIIDGFNEEQLAKTDAALKAIGFSTGTVEDRMAALIGEINKAEKALETYVDVWEDIEDAQRKANNAQELWAAALAGGSEADLEGIERYHEAMEAIAKLSPEGVQQLLAKVQELTGVIIVSTDPTKALAQALGDLFSVPDEAQAKIDALRDLEDVLKDLKESTAEDITTATGLNLGLRDGDLERFVEYQTVVGKAKTIIGQMGLTAEQAALKLKEVTNALDTKALGEKVLEMAERAAEFRDSIAQAFADFAGDAITNFDKIGDAAKNLLRRLQQLFLEQFVTKPLFDAFKSLLGSVNISSLFGGIGGGGGGVGSHSLGGGLSGFAGGGLVGGRGTSTSDSIPAWLSNGEFVMTADAVRKWGVSTLQAMNGGHEPFERVARPRSESNTQRSHVINQHWYISTPDADSFRRSERQILQGSRRKLGV